MNSRLTGIRVQCLYRGSLLIAIKDGCDFGTEKDVIRNQETTALMIAQHDRQTETSLTHPFGRANPEEVASHPGRAMGPLFRLLPSLRSHRRLSVLAAISLTAAALVPRITSQSVYTGIGLSLVAVGSRGPDISRQSVAPLFRRAST